MKSEEIKQLFEQFESAASEVENIEYWSARELQQLLGYSKWENLEKVIQQAKDACKNAGEQINYHFPDVRKMIPLFKMIHRRAQEIIQLLSQRQENGFKVDKIATY